MSDDDKSRDAIYIDALHELANEQADRIQKLEADLETATMKRLLDSNRIEKLEAALIAIKAMHHEGGIDDLTERDDRTYFIVCNALEGKDDPQTDL